ncbi:MAG: thioredoxin family protein [Pseudomonadota bacterium]|nr:thioredoxin family protein [Pseudomonadota bacterium]
MNIKHHVFIGASAFALALVATPAALAAAAGQSAPDFTLADTHGKPVHLADYRGKYVVLEWTNPECPFVQRHYNSRNMPALQKEWRTLDVAWLSINSTNRNSSEYKTGPQLDVWMNAHEASQKAVLIDADSATARLYAAKTTPHMFVINPDGRIVYGGAIDDHPWASADETRKAKNYVRTALTAATAGVAVDPPNTTPYGCSIKY